PSRRRRTVRRDAQPAARTDDRRGVGARARILPADDLEGRHVDPLAGAQAVAEAHALPRTPLEAFHPGTNPIMNTQSPLLGLDLSRPRPSLLARLGRRLMLSRLAEFTRGELRVVEPDGERIYGRRSEDCNVACTLFIDHPQTWADAAFGGTVGAGEAYIRGLWHSDDLTSLVRIFVANRDVMNRMDSRWSFVSRPLL